MVVYFVLAMCLFAAEGYEEVLRLITSGLHGAGRWRQAWRMPSTAAIAKARARLGAAPLQRLFERVCRPVATTDMVGAFYRRWRVVAVDGTTFDLADTPGNDEHFGRPATPRGDGRSAFPQARVVALAECGTHAIFTAAVGPLSAHETVLARQVFTALTPAMLLIADRLYRGHDLWQAAAASGADLLWRARSDAILPVHTALPDGSYLSAIYSDKHHKGPGVTVRVIEYTLDGQDTVYRLTTTILDPQHAPAADLAALYTQRWEFESTLDELKTHQGGLSLILRSQQPDGVRQEIYGFLLVHHAIRKLMHHAAQAGGRDPDRISFTRALRVIRRQATGQAAVSPRQTRPRDHRHDR
jgi:transposase IS4-like protein/DDE family transposase